MLTLESSSKRPKTSPTASSPSSRERFEISLKQVTTQLPEDIQRQILPPEILARDILALRRPESQSEEAGKQLVRFRFLEKHLPQMKDDWKNNVLLHTLRKKHPSLFSLLFKKTNQPDMLALLRAAVQSRNHAAFQGLLNRTLMPLPPQSLKETLKCLALYGQPEKLEQLLARQPEADRPAADQIEKFRNRAQTQQQKIQDFLQLPPEEAHQELFKDLTNRGLFNIFPHETIALLQHPDIDINAHDAEHPHGNTLLQATITLDDAFIFHALLTDPRINVNATNTRGETALHSAASLGRSAMMNALLEFPEIQVNGRDHQGRTPLQRAVETQNKEGMKALLKRPDIDCTLQDPSADTLLHRAAGGGDSDILQALIASGAIDVNARNLSQETPLHWAVLMNAAPAVRSLLETPGIEVNPSDLYGVTPLSLATRNSNPAIANMLRQHGATE